MTDEVRVFLASLREVIFKSSLMCISWFSSVKSASVFKSRKVYKVNSQYGEFATEWPSRFTVYDYQAAKLPATSSIENIEFIAVGRPDLDSVKLSLPISWEMDPYSDVNWKFQFSGLRVLDRILIAYEKSKDINFLKKALAILEDWYSYHILEGNSHSYAWYDMSVGIRASKIAYIYRALSEGGVLLSSKQLSMFVDIMEKHIQHLCEERNISPNNHGLFQIHGLTALLSAFDGQAATSAYKEALKFAKMAMSSLISAQFDKDFIHTENSPEYHSFILRTLSGFRRTGWYDDFHFLQEIMDRGFENKRYFFLPSGEIIRNGDTGNTTLTEEQRPLFEKTVEKRFEFSGIDIYASSTSAAKNNRYMLYFWAGFHSAGHRQSDDFNIHWFDKGQSLLVDAGKYSYTKDKYRSYIRSTRAHNTVEVDKKDLPRLQKNVYGSALKEPSYIAGNYLTQAKVDHSDLGVVHHRIIFFKPNEHLIVIDSITAIDDQEHKTTQWWHLHESANMISQNKGESLFNVGGVNMRIWTKVLRGQSEGEILIKGQEREPLQGWISREYNKVIPNYALGTSSNGFENCIAAYFDISDGCMSSDVNIELVGNTVEICKIHNGSKELLVCNLRAPETSVIRKF